jgi:UDP-2,4-diacetamido-2,4,6-trideoxy-beta-L-altropyranose hydrolase
LENQSIVIRADATSRIGTGHLMRCLALAQSWKSRGAEVTFISCSENNALRQRLLDQGMQITTIEQPYPDPMDWEITSQVVRKSSATWVVLDGYHFDFEYQNQIKKNGQHLLVIDDTAHRTHYCADIVLNQNMGADRLEYSCENYTRLMVGPQYALLRSEFLAWRGWKREIPNVATKVLVTLGGADYQNATLKALRALERFNCSDLEVKMVVGAYNPNIEMLRNAVQSAQFSISILSNVGDMAKLMAWADVAIAAAGSTCWELAFMKLPFAAIILAENQEYISEDVEKAGIGVRCGWHHELDPKSLEKQFYHLIYDRSYRARMSDNAGKVVDGFGAERILDAIEEVV